MTCEVQQIFSLQAREWRLCFRRACGILVIVDVFEAPLRIDHCQLELSALSLSGSSAHSPLIEIVAYSGQVN